MRVLKRSPLFRIATFLAAATLVAFAIRAGAQAAPPPNTQQATQSALNTSDAVPAGTNFLVRLDDALNTRKDKAGRKFTVTIVEPLETAGGAVLPPGSKITGHITRVESAAVTGRARLWLAFDDLKSDSGRVPIVAEVSGVPDGGNVKPGPGKEGEIEARSGSAERQAETAAAGAAVGAAVGGAAGGGRGVAEGAIAGGAIAFLVSRNYASEIELPKGARLELALDRPLYITQP